MGRIAATLLAIAALSGAAEAQDEAPSPLHKIRTKRVSVEFEDTSLRDAVRRLEKLTDVEFLIDRKHIKEPETLRVSLTLKDIRVISVLKIMLGQHDLGAVYDGGLIVIKPRPLIDSIVRTRVYDVRDLTLRIPDFPGPRIQLAEDSPEQAGGGIVFLLEAPEEREIDEESLIDILRTATGRDAWEENEHTQIRLTPGGLLLVTQTQAVHKKIERVLEMLRKF